jgi:predicted DNA-binding transcriptional regulator AlpA
MGGESEPLLKARDIASFLGIEPETLLDHFEKGEVPGYRLYGRKGAPVRFRLSEIEAWLESCRHGALPPAREAGDPDGQPDNDEVSS